MNVIEFPKNNVPLTAEELESLQNEVADLAQILCNQLGRLENFESLNDPLDYTVGDFYLITKVLLLTRLEMLDMLNRIMDRLDA